jgi:hypothetical protein
MKVQELYLDQVFMLKRLDYTTDVFGAVGAHYCYDPVTFDGIVIPTLRHMVRRTPDGPLFSGRTSFILITSASWCTDELEHRSPIEDGGNPFRQARTEGRGRRGYAATAALPTIPRYDGGVGSGVHLPSCRWSPSYLLRQRGDR